jgi:hypothetical protein
MADRAEVRRIALSLPGTVEGTDRFAFSVPNKGKLKGFAWAWMERVHPRKPKVENTGVIAVRVTGEVEKAGLIAANPEVYFTEPHYNGFPAVLVRLAAIDVDELREVLVDGWRCQAPPDLVADSGL